MMQNWLWLPGTYNDAEFSFPFVRLFDRRRRAVVTLDVTAEADVEAAGGECGVVGNWYV
jgi:hypothetical protein